MATLDNNTYYYIISAASLVGNTDTVPQALDVSGGSIKDGANIQTWGINRCDAQIWRRNNDKLVNRICGKFLSVNVPFAHHSNVVMSSMSDDTDMRFLLRFDDSSKTVTYNDKTYNCYYISLSSWEPNTYAIAPIFPIPIDGTNVELLEKSQISAQYQPLWIFVPVEDFRPGGVYEIVPMSDKRLRVDVTSGGDINGTNVRLYGANSTNRQKFYIDYASGVEGGYKIRNIATGRYVDVEAGAAYNGANVQVWDGNGTRAQTWDLVPYGTSIQYIDGTRCGLYRLRSHVTPTGATDYFMDVWHAITARNSNVLINRDARDSNLFALKPTYATDPKLPVPEISCVKNANSPKPIKMFRIGTDVCRPRWTLPESYLSKYDTHYEIRFRCHGMKERTSTWEEWQSWSTWITPTVVIKGNQATSISYWSVPSSSGYKAWEIQYQVRMASADETKTSQLVGTPGTTTATFYYNYDLSFTQLVWAPDGLHVGWTTQYDAGSTEIKLVSIKERSGLRRELLKYPVVISGSTFESSGLVPQDALERWITSETPVTLVFYKGYDAAHAAAMPEGTAFSVNATITQTGGTAYIEPSIHWDGPRLLASVESVGPTGMWVRLSDGSLWECPLDSKVGNRYTFEVIYPVGVAYDLLISAADSTGAIWSVMEYPMEPTQHRVHAFYWGDHKEAFLEHFLSGGEAYQETREAVYEADILDDRPLESVSSTNTVKTRFTISGTLSEASYSTADDVKAMINEHVIWRAPDNGEFALVYIAAGTFTERNNRTEVTLTAIEEAR